MRFATLLTCTLLPIVCGCAVSPPDNTLSYRPGEAVVEAVRPARVELPRRESGAIAGSEAAGGSYGSPIERLFRPRWIEGYQLSLRMSDGTVQRVTQDSSAFQVGERVQVTQDGRVIKSTAAVISPVPAASVPAPAASVPPPPASTTRAPSALRPGVGIVESASVVALPSSSPAAGGTAQPTMAYRLRMADGSAQDVVQSGPRFQVGERAQLTRDGRLVRP